MDRASRRQRQLERKYSSYRKYTAAEDVNYLTHSSRSSYKAESVTQRTSPAGRSSSTEVVSGSETRSLPVFIAIQDYNPDASDTEAIPLEQGQIVEVLDNKNPASWLVRTKARPPRTGWVPGSYFETPTNFYKQRRQTRELSGLDMKLTEEQEAILKRDQVYHDLLKTEEDFVTSLRSVLDNYVHAFDDAAVPPEAQEKKSELTLNIRELYNFHANVMLKGLQYYSDDPGKVGQTFVRLERDFDHHVNFYRELPHVLETIESQPTIRDFLQGISDKVEAGARTYADYLKQISERNKQYEEYFKEIIKYSTRAQCSTRSMQKALELVQSIPKRADDAIFTKNILHYPGDTNRLGRIYRHDLFQVVEGEETPLDRYIFLFRNKLMITDRDNNKDPAVFKHYATIRLDKYTVRQHTTDDDSIVLKPNEPGLPSFRIKAKDTQSQEYVRKAWLKDLTEMQEAIAAESSEADSLSLTTDFGLNVSDARSEFSEYSSMSRKSSSFTGPEEGPPRKKIKSPPVISPTGSSASLFSGGSSIDWTTTGTTLEMQGTRVTRTQYGFRTLQESSAKMCLKVTGYPLPEITWYKDGELLKEDERHTFYADEDGFFAMTIDPVQVTDTGRYTCVATNEYGQASTSAFFRVLKVEKEAAPPAFVSSLKDQECKEGDVVNFECEVEGWPEPELVWLVDDQPLRPSHDFRLQYDGQNAKLEIRDAQPEDTGTYTVKITNEYGSLESNAKLLVQPDPDKNHVPPEFQAVIEDVECDEGDTVKFKAVLTGDPDPEVIWFVNGIPLTESEKIKFISEDGICIVTIKDVSRHFDGMVTCQGKNRLGTTSCEGRLRVRVPPKAPEFERPLEDRVITEKSAVMFETDVSGFPDPKVEFFLKGKPLVHGQDGVTIEQRDGYYRVTIQNCSIDGHDGEVLARATNQHGQAECRARLIVEPEEEESRSAPTFIKDIEDQTVKFGETAVFETSVRGSPNPTVSWFLNGQQLDRSSPGVVIEPSGADHTLRIDSSKYAGTILCRAENPIGRFETKARLIVLPVEKKKKAPEFTQKLSDKVELEGNTAVFEVTVDAEPKATFKWTLDGKELVENERVHFREFEGSSKLEINDIKFEEAGRIKCVATNSEGEASTEAGFTVKRKDQRPTFAQKLNNLTVERGDEAVFEARVIAVPEAEFKWSIGGRRVFPTTEGVRIETDVPNGVSRLIIDTKVFGDASQTISVSAENKYGVDETGAQLTVNEPSGGEVPAKRRREEEEKLAEAGQEQAGIQEPATRRVTEESLQEAGETTTGFGEAPTPMDTAQPGTAQGGGETVQEISTTRFEESITEKLEFTKQLTDQTVQRGQKAKFEAEVRHAREVRWSVAGTPVSEATPGVVIREEVREESRRELTLTLDSNIHTPGTVICRAIDKMGESQESRAEFGVTEKPKPKFGTSLGDLKANQGEPLRVEIAADDANDFKWTLNGQPLKDGVDGVHITKEPGKSTLVIDKVGPEHAGRLSVQAENESGSAESSGQVSVTPTATEPRFRAQLENKSVEEGEPLRWDVALENPTPDTQLTWFLNDKKLEPSATVQISDHGDGTYHLTLSHATPGMNGVVKCKATNSKGDAESTGKVEVRPKAQAEQKPAFSKQPQDHEVEQDWDRFPSVKFSAIVTGHPAPSVTWYLNDTPIVSSDAIRVKPLEPETGKTSIRIIKPRTDQSGTVKVRAENSLGTVEATAKLTVSPKSELPYFTTDIKDRQINEGDSAKFVARVQGYPEPSVQWTLKDKPLTAGPHVKISRDGDTHTLEIVDAPVDFSGELACIAQNSVGSKRQNVQLGVKEVGQAPLFSKNLEDRMVEEKETLIMEAQLAKVKPKPTVTWLRDGKPLTSDDHFKLSESEDGALKLTIISTELEDKSRITIKAENSFGTAETAASIGVNKRRGFSKPAFLSDLATITVSEGDTLQAKVIISGEPTPYAKWYINNQLVYQTEDTQITNENGVYSLVIHGCTTDMTGTIKCVAGNKMGEASTEGKLTVIRAIPVEFETSLCDAVCREGDTLKLKAVLVGEPMPDVSWFVNGKKLVESQNIKIHADKGTYTVTIKDITCDYSGKVVCEAVNEFGKASSEANLQVLPRGEPPDFLEWLNNIRARQGTTVVHKVVFTGTPKPVLTWYLNGQELISNDEITIVTDDTTSTLTIKSFNPDRHIGEIICKAENDAGEVSCTANMGLFTSDMLTESESDMMSEDRYMEEFDEEKTVEREEITRTPTPVMAPAFITKIRNTRAQRGHQAVFECVVPDTKGVCCKWLKDGKEIELIARIRVQVRTIEGFTTNELVIDDVQPEDAGKYTVIVENTAGRDRCEATLTVVESLEKPPQREPEFTVNLRDKTANTADKVMFECKAGGEPEPKITWYKDNEKLTPDEKVTIESDEGVQRLVLDKVEPEDAGKYKCVAENDVGKAETEAQLTVKTPAPGELPPGPPEFVELLKSATTTVGGTAVLRCKVRGNPRPTISWTREGQPLKESDRVKTEYLDDGTIILTVKDTTMEDTGEYRCEAENEYGSAWTEGPIVVAAEGTLPTEGEAPDFIEPVRPVTVMQGETAVLEGKITGSPAPDVKWYKGDKPISPADDRFKIENLPDGTQRLTIKDAKLEDMGDYRCEATNKWGDVWSDVTLTVQVPSAVDMGPEGVVAPSFLKTLQETQVHEGEPVEFEVIVKGEPKPEVKFFKDSKEIKAADSHFQQSAEPDGTTRLTILAADAADAGTYRCEASNPAGTARSEAPLRVIPTGEAAPLSEVAPEFLQELKPVQANEGDKAVFECKVAGTPQPKVRWFKDGQELKDGDGCRIEALPDGTHRLILDNCKVDDQGNYRVEATNDAGSTSSKAPLTVKPSERLRLKKGLEDQNIPVGVKLQLSVEVEGKPKTVKWFKGHEEVSASAKTKIEKATDEEYRLVIEKADLSDTGAYRVVFTTDTESIESSCKVTVYEEAKKPSFKKGLTDQSVPKGSPVTLEVEVDGKPNQVKWYKDGKPVDEGRAKPEDLGNGRFALRIPEAGEEDFGRYTVRVINDAGEAESSANLSPKDARPEIVSGLKPAAVKQGEPAVFEVKMKEPVKQVKWYKNGKEMENPQTEERPSECAYRLIIPNAQADDQAEYKVVVSNDAGQADSAAPLTVTAPAAAIGFVKGLKDEAVNAKEKGVLEVETNKPPKRIQWFKNGKEIEPSDKAEPKKVSDTVYRLEIPDADADDAAQYTVKVSDDDGNTADSSAKLTVKLPAEPIAFVRGLEDQTVKPKDKAVLEVETNKLPKQIKWYKNGKEIQPSDKAEPKKVSDTVYRLEIPDAGKDDDASYTVKVSDDDGATADSPCHLTVKLPAEEEAGKPAKAIGFVRGLEDQSVEPKKTGIFEVETTRPPKDINWYKNGKEIQPGDKAQPKKVSDTVYRLEVPDADADDTAKYTVKVSDDDGNTADSAAQLTVKLPAEAPAAKPGEAIGFVRGLEDQTIQPKDKGVLEVETTRTPKDVKWFKNGKEIQPGDKAQPKKVSDTVYRLEVPDADADDTAKYTVKVSDDDGNTADSSAQLTVKLLAEAPATKPGEAIGFVRGLEDQTVQPKDKGVFEVETTRPPKDVKWFKNGKELQPSDKVQPKKVSDTVYRLEIPDADADDTAKYTVKVSDNDGNTADSSAQLTVKLPAEAQAAKPGEAIGFVRGLEDQAVKQKEKGVLEVETNRPPKQVKWFKNGKEIQPGDKAQPKKVSDTVYRLEIPDAVLDDTADYTVKVSDDDGNTADSSCHLTVKLAPIQITKRLQDQKVGKGETAILEIETSDKPRETKWYKNGKEVKPGDKAQPKKVSDTVYRLEVPDADEEDTADFKVVVVGDDDQTDDSSCKLTVVLPAEKAEEPKKAEEEPKKVEEEPRKAEEEPMKAEEGPKEALEGEGKEALAKEPSEPVPAFLRPLKDLEVVEGEKAEFFVETNCKPRTVKWYRNGKEITPDDRIQLVAEDTKYRYVIKAATKDDAGTYKVVLENSSGKADSSAQLAVTKRKPDLPRIVKGLEDQIVAKGDAIVFEVKIEGDVTEIRWLKDGQPVAKAISTAVPEKVDDTTYRLTIPKADLGDAGQFEVQAINDAGKAKSEAKAEVDEAPRIVRGLAPATVAEGDDQVFRVEVSAPVRDVKWYKNGQEIKPSPHFELKSVTPKKYELAINKAQLDDGATYKVVLSNKAGSCDSEAALTVEKLSAVRLIKGLEDTTVDEGQPLELSCKIDGTPKDVIWYKNGKEIAPDERIRLNANPATGEYSLLIPQSIPSDAAAYRVVFTQDRGGDVYSGAVGHVKTKKAAAEAKPAMFLSPLRDVDVVEGDNLTLKCQVAGEPQPKLRWFRNGVELTPDDRTVMRLALDGTATLRIKDAQKGDAGEFRVEASNEAGTADSSCNVRVTAAAEQPSAPKFIIPLKWTDAPIGGKVEFNVKVRGAPKPIVTFFINNRAIPIDGQRVTLEDMHDGNWSLTIRDVQETDFGKMRAVAENENGKDECEAEFIEKAEGAPKKHVDEGYAPRFNVPLWDRRVPAGQPMFIECHVDAKPGATIEWFKDNKVLKESDNVHIENTSDGACRVKVDRWSEDYVGIYKCVATNTHGIADTSASYFVEKEEPEVTETRKSKAPRFNPALEDKTVSEGDTLTLTCGVEGTPKPTVTWFKDGIPLVKTDKVRPDYDPESGRCTLTVTDATDADKGAYRCVAANEHGSTNTACMVGVKTAKAEVKKEGAEPFFTKGLVDQYVDRGDTLILKCAVTGDPTPEIKFYRNGVLLRPSNRITIELSPDGECTLTISDCTLSDEGIYRCEAENKHGKAKTQCTAHVDMTLSKAEKKPVEVGEAPRFIIPLEDMTVFLGSFIDLECKVAGQPMPQVKWSKDGNPIWEDARYEWDNDPASGHYRLKIRDATVYDEGTYRCVATNDSGSATTKAFVRIDDGSLGKGALSEEKPPRFAVKLNDVRVMEGEPLKLECRVEASPLPEMTWYKDGAKVVPSDRVQLEQLPDGTARLIIPKSTLDDDGIYRVVATNPSGSAQDKCTATVKKAPAFDKEALGPDVGYEPNKAPRLITPLDNIKVPEGQPFILRCKFAGEPRPSIKWFKDGERVYDFAHCRLAELEDGSCELHVDAATRADAGCYRCVAENPYGSARTTGEVTVKLTDRKPRNIDDMLKQGKAPGFSIPLTVKHAKPGDTVVFECLPYGDPFPAIKWMKDGMELSDGAGVHIESLPDGTQKLIVDNVEFLSEGYYRCVATNEHGTASTKAELTVAGDRRPKLEPVPEENGGEPEESKPRIRRGLYNQTIHQGSSVDMVVCATGWPTPTVKWYKDGEPLESEGREGRRVIWTDDRGLHHLVILNLGPEDEGDYSLVATNKLGEARTEGTLGVIRPREAGEAEPDGRHGMPFPPGFIRQLKNKHVFTHMPTIFDCLVVGHPPPEVEWFHNGKRITPGGRIKIQHCGGGSHALLITDTVPDDAGEYVAIAKNSAGTASSSAILDVTVPHLDNIKFDGSYDVTPYLTEEYGFKKLNFHCLPTPPDYGPFIKEVTGHYLTLSWIPTKRSPPRYPQVTYVIEIRELPYREWSLLDYNIPEPVCKVRNLELGKSYQFRVRAENIYGISDPSPASPPSRLMAPPAPVLDKNKRVIPLLDPYAERALDEMHAEQYACAPWFAPGVVDKRYCAENDTLTIALNYSGYPDPKIQWKFRGWDVDTTSPTSNIRVSTYAGTETVLTVFGFSKNNAGQYQCIATNQYGDAQQNIHVDVANRPVFIQPLSNRTVSDGKPLRLDVRVEGNPKPELKWMKEWHPLAESSRVKFVEDGPYLYSLIINDPMWRDTGVYSCVAVNPAGQATTSCTITVESDDDYGRAQPPRKKVALEAKKVREIYEIAEEDEKKAAAGATFRVTERATGERFLAQLKPLDDKLSNYLSMHNVLDCPALVQLKEAIADQGLVVLIFDNADRSLLDSLVAAPTLTITDEYGDDTTAPVSGKNREEQVRVFVKQLLTALQYMHHRNIAHLDLRPEAILLQDTHLRLADFGQSRHLLRGKATGDITSTPEFVSPEVALGHPVTLAADMWSAGALTYVLLAGISPFLGDNDHETLNNVVNGNYTLDVPEFEGVSPEGKDFIKRLLALEPVKRLSVDEALAHDWISDPALADAKLMTDCLREFKYKHKWLERRVFVQQTPADQLIKYIDTPKAAMAQVQQINAQPAGSAQPLAVYDYLKIKEMQPPVDPNAKPLPPPRGQSPQRAAGQPIVPPPGFPPLPPGFRLPPGVSAEEFFAALMDPRRGAFVPPQPKAPSKSPSPGQSPTAERRRLQPQPKGEAPSQEGGYHPPKKTKPQIDPNGPQPPIQLIRGERRQIEEEIANRILSDISEENSVAGSIISLDELADRDRDHDAKRQQQRKSRSRSSTPQASESTTPLASPALTIESVDPIQQFFGDREVPPLPELDDPKVPVGAPLFLEGLGKGPIITTEGSLGSPLSAASLSPSTPGTKSPILHSPAREHNIQVVIATKRGRQQKTSPFADSTEDLTADDVDAAGKKAESRISTHHDDGFDLIMNGVDRIKSKYRQEKEALDAELDKYRPKNVLKEKDIEFSRPAIDVDDYPWDSDYQIGPDTLLLATRGPEFNARVRDYRRELWGDGAPLVHQGILGYRNADITVRERRRFTDLLREDPHIRASVENTSRDLEARHGGAVRRIKSDISKLAPLATRKNTDGTFGAIFRSRLRDVCFLDNASSFVLECKVAGNPAPEVTFFHQESAISEDGRHKVYQEGDTWRLTILSPIVTDIGEYSCSASNEHGSDKCSCRVITGDPPGRPSRPDVELAADTEVLVTWEPPEIATFIEGIVYRLECRLAGENDHFAPFTVISDHIEDEAVVVKHLNPAGVYQFRVTAMNGFGWGVPSLTSRIIRTHARGAPKLDLQMLRTQLHFSIVTMPQKISKRGVGLTEISEEQEDEMEEEAGAESDSSVASTIKGEELTLNSSDDPMKRFQLEAEIFRGRYSIVRAAVDSRRGGPSHCVAKIRALNGNAQEALKEFEFLKESQNDNVVKLLSGYHRKDCLLLFTERLHENVFERFTYRDAYNEEQICLTIRQLASALHWVHFKGIVHLDVQPNNVMFTNKHSWIVKLIDFERAQSVSDDSQPPKKPTKVNPEWAAPELMKEDGQISVQADMWGLGIIAFTLLAGFHPFSDDDTADEEVRRNVLSQKCDPNLIPVQASQEALRFATWALKKDPVRRMRTDEALSHRFLASDAAMVRRRENIKYPSNRLNRTAARTMKRPSVTLQMSSLAPFSAHPSAIPPRNGNGLPPMPNGMPPPPNGMPMPNGFPAPRNGNGRMGAGRSGRASAEV